MYKVNIIFVNWDYIYLIMDDFLFYVYSWNWADIFSVLRDALHGFVEKAKVQICIKRFVCRQQLLVSQIILIRLYKSPLTKNMLNFR